MPCRFRRANRTPRSAPLSQRDVSRAARITCPELCTRRSRLRARAAPPGRAHLVGPSVAGPRGLMDAAGASRARWLAVSPSAWRHPEASAERSGVSLQHDRLGLPGQGTETSRLRTPQPQHGDWRAALIYALDACVLERRHGAEAVNRPRAIHIAHRMARTVAADSATTSPSRSIAPPHSQRPRARAAGRPLLVDAKHSEPQPDPGSKSREEALPAPEP